MKHPKINLRHLRKLPYLKEVRWYDVPNYILNQLTAGDFATCVANLKYAEDARQHLDLYLPKTPRADGALILFVHGGSWQHGEKENYTFLAQSFAEAGFYVACMNYRFAPQHIYPSYVEDVIDACNWLTAPEQAAQYDYNPQKIILMGHSAGAFNIMAAVYHPKWQHNINDLNAIDAIIGVAGPYSFEHRHDPVAMYAFAQDIAPDLIMPDHFVFQNSIKHLLILASKDQLVADDNTYTMQKALKGKQNQVEVLTIPHTTHVSVIATVARGLNKIFNTKQAIIDFIDGTSVTK